MKKRILLVLLALTMIINCAQLIVFATGAENSSNIDVFLESGGKRVFQGAYATFNEAVSYINGESGIVNAHFIIELNKDTYYTHNDSSDKYTGSSPYITYTNGSGSRTITVTAESKSTVLYLDGHNGIRIGIEDKDDGGVDYTQNINLNLEGLTVTHNLTGSLVQYYAHGTLNINNCIINVPLNVTENDDSKNYAVINTMTATGKSATVNITDSEITVTRTASQWGYSVVRSGNYRNNLTVNIDRCDIRSTVAMYGIYVYRSTPAQITMKDTTFSTFDTPEGGTRYAICKNEEAGNVNVTLDSCMFYKNGALETNINTALSMNTLDSVTFNGFSSVGGYSTFPDLVITEVHLESINVEAEAGPYNQTKPWPTMSDWWPAANHPASRGSLTGDFLRYIEIYNSSKNPIDLNNYKIVVDTNAFVSGSQINEIPIVANAKVGSAQNPQTTILDPGKTAVIYLYNSNDAALRCTLESFAGYYSWRYDGSDPAPELNTAPLAPTGRDKHLVVDLSNTLIIAVDDIGTSPSDTKLGDFCNNSIIYGIVKDDVTVSESKDAWTSWALFEHYYQTYVDSTTGLKTNGNQANESTFNFLYGLDSSGDIREGRRLNEVRPTYNCNPGLLQEMQKLNFTQTSEAPKVAITEINNVTKLPGSATAMDGDYDYFEVANISSGDINIYDYCMFQRYNITHIGGDDDAANTFKDFSIHYFDRVSYIIPGDYGDIQCFSNKSDQDGETNQMLPFIGNNRVVRFTNPNRYDQNGKEVGGILHPGETAIIWMYDESTYINGGTRESFAEFFKAATGVAPDTSKIFALSGFRNQTGEQENPSLGISNTQCSIFGIGEIKKFAREDEISPEKFTKGTGYETLADRQAGTNPITINLNSYPELKKENFVITNKDYPAKGFPLSKCESVVFMFSSMICAGGINQANIGTNVGYQYASAYVNGMALRFSGFLKTISPDSLINENGQLVDQNGNVVSTPQKGSVDLSTWVATPTKLSDTQQALVSSFSNNSYSIVYHSNTPANAQSIQYVYAGTKIVLPSAIDGFTNAGYYLNGWSLTANDKENVLLAGSTYTVPSAAENGQIHLYADWEPGAPEKAYIISIPATLIIGETTSGALNLSVDMRNFSTNDTLIVYVDSANNPKYNLVNTQNSNLLLPYRIENQKDKNLYVEPGFGVDTAIARFVSDGTTNNQSTTLIATLKSPPIYAGVYTDTLTFKVVAPSGANPLNQ